MRQKQYTDYNKTLNYVFQNYGFRDNAYGHIYN